MERVSLLLGCTKLCSLCVSIIKQLYLDLFIALLDLRVSHFSHLLGCNHIFLSQHLFL